MKITRHQLRRLIMEASGYDGGEPIQLGGYILERDLEKLKTKLLDAFDPEDWVMAGNGYPAWIRQVDTAMAYVKDKVGKDASLVDSVGAEAFDMLMIGDFAGGTKWKTKAYDDDLDDEFADFLASLADDDYELEAEDVQLQPELDIETERGPVMHDDNVVYPDFKV